jgi:hypothetical protein
LRLLGRLLGGVPPWKQGQGVYVSVRFGRQANPEMDVGLRPFGIAAGPDRSHHLTFADRGPDPNPDRSKVDERHRVSVCGANRQTAAFVRQLAREGHDAGRGSPDLGARRPSDIDAAVLPARVRIVVRQVRPQDGAVDRPGPRRRAGDMRKRDEQDHRRENRSVANFANHAATVTRQSAVVKSDYSEAR